jgi:hypothetical protein
MRNKAISSRARERVNQFSRYQKRAFLRAFGSEQMDRNESSAVRVSTLPRNERRTRIRWTLSALHTR